MSFNRLATTILPLTLVTTTPSDSHASVYDALASFGYPDALVNPTQKKRSDIVFLLQPSAKETTAKDPTQIIEDIRPQIKASLWFMEGTVSVDALNVVDQSEPDFGANYGAFRQGRILIGKDPESGTWSGFATLGVQGGSALDVLSAPISEGSRNEKQFDHFIRHIPRFYAGLSFPKGAKLTLGLQYLPVGVDDDSIHENDFISYSIQQRFLPSYALGASLVYPINDTHTLQAWLINGWQIAGDPNKAPSYILGHQFKKKKFNLNTLVFLGPEQKDARLKAWRGFGEFMFNFNLTDTLQLGGSVDIGFERQVDLLGTPMYNFLTVGSSVSKKILPRWMLALRGEIHRNQHGLSTSGIPENLAEITLANSIDLTKNLSLRGEYRYDRSYDDYVHTDNTFSISLIGGFKRSLR